MSNQPPDYKIPKNGNVPTNAETFGFLYHHRDSRTKWRIDHKASGTPAQPIISPDKDNMYMTAVWVFLRDEADFNKEIPSFRFSLYKDVSGDGSTPMGATKLCETPIYQIPRTKVPSDHYWNRCEFEHPEKWTKNKQQWMVRDGYNGEYRVTSAFKKTDNNKEGYLDERPYWIVPNDPDTTPDPRTDVIKEHGAYPIKQYNKQFIFYIEYTIGLPTYGTPEPTPEPEPIPQPKPMEERMNYAEMEIKDLKTRMVILENK